MADSNSLSKDLVTKFFIDYASEIIFIFDSDFKIIDVNRTFNILFGYKKEEVVGRKITELIFEGSLSEFEHLNQISDGVNTFVSRFISKDKRTFWFEVKVMREETGFFLAIGKDISQQKETEERLFSRNRELEEERARTKAMLENIGDGVIGIKASGDISYINRQTTILLGFAQEDLLGNMITKVIKLVDEKGNEVQIDKRPIHGALFHNKKVSDNKHSYLKKDGEPLPVAITATPINVGGFVMGGVLVFRDITKERDIDRMKTEFLSLASHQLRTPLSATKWFVELIMDESGNLTDEQKEMMNNVYQSNERMIDLVNALLNITRIESGRIMIEPEDTDISKLVAGVVSEVQPKLKEKNHNLVVSVNPDLPTVSIDPKLIRHVYLNLLTNAIKYTKEGGQIEIAVSLADEEILSRVTDNGYGIPVKQQERVFQKFFRADNVIKVETDGSGLGLYLAKSIVVASGGRMWFESAEGQGTTFWFSLPLRGTPAQKGEVTIDE